MAATTVVPAADPGTFEYLLNVSTVVKNGAAEQSPVFYMDRGVWYQFKVKINDLKAMEMEKKLYFQVQLDFVNEDARRSRDQLMNLWYTRHPETRLLELGSLDEDSPGRVLYDEKRDNMVRFITDGAQEVQFSIKLNCLESQFFKENPVDCEKEGFYLMVSTSLDESGMMMDTTLCRVRTFWKGRATSNYDTDRYNLLDLNPKVACPDKYALIQTILNPSSNAQVPVIEDDIEIIEMPQTLGSVLGSPMKINLNLSHRELQKLLSARNQDERRFVCILQAPLNLGQSSTYLDKGSVYGLVLKPMNFDRTEFPGPLQTSIYLDFGSAISASRLNTALSNWSIISQEKFIFSLDHESSDIEECVHDVYQNSSKELNLIWSPGNVREIKLALKFNTESSKLARFLDIVELEFLSLVVETSEMKKDGLLVERSDCQVRIFSPGISARQLQIDQADPSLSTTRVFEEYTIMKNTTPKNPVTKPKPVDVTETIPGGLYPDITSSCGDDFSNIKLKVEQVNLKIMSVHLDMEKLVTLQERLTLVDFTIFELEQKILDLIRRKSSQMANSVRVFLQDMQLTDELVPILFTEEETNFELALITNDSDTGEYLAYLNLYIEN